MRLISNICNPHKDHIQRALAVRPRRSHQSVPFIHPTQLCHPCHLGQQVLYVPNTHLIPWRMYTSLIKISCMPIAVDRPQIAAVARRRNSANPSRTSRSVHQCSTTTATVLARLCSLASTRTQAFLQTHLQLAQSIQQTAKPTRPPHQAQAAPGATATTSLERLSKKNDTTKSAHFHSPTLSAKLHVSINLLQPLPRHPA
jgi:hypothetical protein